MSNFTGTICPHACACAYTHSLTCYMICINWYNVDTASYGPRLNKYNVMIFKLTRCMTRYLYCCRSCVWHYDLHMICIHSHDACHLHNACTACTWCVYGSCTCSTYALAAAPFTRRSSCTHPCSTCIARVHPVRITRTRITRNAPGSASLKCTGPAVRCTCRC